MGYLGLALVIGGALVLLYGFANTNIEAPQESDYGNRFVWPGIYTFAAGVLCLLVRLGMWIWSLV